MTSLTKLLSSMEREGDTFLITPTEDWTQGRTVYGGLSLALAAHATRLAFPDLPPLRSAQAAFTGAASGALKITPTLLNAGKSSAFVSVDIHSDSGIALRATLCFGKPRTSTIQFQTLPMPTVPQWNECPEFFGNGVSPGFSVQFESRLAGKDALVSSSSSADLMAWFRHRDLSVGDSEVGLLAMADAPPTSAMLMMSEPAPISTMTWSIDVLNEAFSNCEWHLVRSVGEFIGDGYCSQAMTLWDSNGRPLLIGRQTVAIYR